MEVDRNQLLAIRRQIQRAREIIFDLERDIHDLFPESSNYKAPPTPLINSPIHEGRDDH